MGDLGGPNRINLVQGDKKIVMTGMAGTSPRKTRIIDNLLAI